MLLELVHEMSPFAVLSMTFLTPDLRRRLQAAGVHRLLDLETRDDAQGPPDRPWELPIGQLQVDHLAARGFDRIVYALPEESTRLEIARARLRGAAIECATLGLDRPIVLSLPLDRAIITERLLSLDRIPGRTGLCAYEDQIAIGVLAAMHDLGWSAPDDLAVIGCDDLPVASLVVPALTTVSVDAGQVGAQFAEAFVALGDQEFRTEWVAPDLEYELRIRSSS
jgi:DNA-binding LacI/PurR family transcriptional regulator